ncbi:hypothetical protein, partial [Pseudomonas aeruginosa]|uniref:hypothetical protein n=1 Tax=Pseudomonas aeruginosa TaxID=287 RepID=UPI001F2CF8D1
TPRAFNQRRNSLYFMLSPYRFDGREYATFLLLPQHFCCTHLIAQKMSGHEKNRTQNALIPLPPTGRVSWKS